MESQVQTRSLLALLFAGIGVTLLCILNTKTTNRPKVPTQVQLTRPVRKTRSVNIESIVAEPTNVRRSRSRLIDNPGNGDCLFHCFKQATNNRYTVKDLRKAVADSIDQDQFETLRVIYDGAVTEKEFGVMADYNFMQGVQCLPHLKARMMTNRYWGDEMALTTLEKFTGIKALVIKDSPARGAFFASRIDDTFQSDRYLLLHLSGNHYQLLAVDEKRIFTNETLPPNIKTMMKRKTH